MSANSPHNSAKIAWPVANGEKGIFMKQFGEKPISVPVMAPVINDNL